MGHQADGLVGGVHEAKPSLSLLFFNGLEASQEDNSDWGTICGFSCDQTIHNNGASTKPVTQSMMKEREINSILYTEIQ